MHGGRRGPTTTTEHRRIDVRGLLALAPGQMKMAHVRARPYGSRSRIDRASQERPSRMHEQPINGRPAGGRADRHCTALHLNSACSHSSIHPPHMGRTSWVFEFGFFQLHNTTSPPAAAAAALLDNETKAKCSSCGTAMSATSSGGTSHMQRHLTRACNSLLTRAAARFVKKVADDARRARRRQSPPPLTNTSTVSTYQLTHY